MLKAITAHSTKSSGQDIICDLVTGANKQLGIYRPQAGILYASCPCDTEKAKEILHALCATFPGVEIIGGTVVGGFTIDSGYVKDGYFLCFLVSDTVRFTTGRITDLAQRIEGESLTEDFKENITASGLRENPSACLLFSAYNEIQGDILIERVQEAVPAGCVVVGGVATDYWSEQDIRTFSQKVPPAEQTFLFYARHDAVYIRDNTLVYLLFSGRFSVDIEVSYGWSDVGILYPGRADGQNITEIDGKLPHTFLSELKHPLSSLQYDHVDYPLWFHVPGKDPFIRDIFFNRQTGAYYTQGASLPAKFHVSFSFPTRERVIDEYQRCLNRLNQQYDFSFIVTCCAHLGVLGEEVHSEYSVTAKSLHNTPCICGYFFGEFGPSSPNPESMLHSCSSIICCFRETRENLEENSQSISLFLKEIIQEQRREIASLEKQLRFFEQGKERKAMKMTEDCLGILLCRSHRSLSSQAEQISDALKNFYRENNIDPPYATSRNRLIDHLKEIKNSGKKFV